MKMNKDTRQNIIVAAIFSAACISAAFFYGGCTTNALVGTAIATGEQATGDVYANAKLGKVDGSPAGTAAQKQAIADLTRVGVDLTSFTAGTLAFGELGAVEAQLKIDGVALSSNTAAVNQITSILNIFAHNVAGPNGTVLPQQALAEGVVANIVSGFGISEKTYVGQWSVTNPTQWTAPTTRLSVQSPFMTASVMKRTEEDPLSYLVLVR